MEKIVIRKDVGAVAVLTINRPERLNAFSLELGDAIVLELAAIAKDDSIGAVVLTGSGEQAFCAGTDLKDPNTHAVPSVDAHLADVKRISADRFFSTLLAFRKPIICAVNGYAVGIGFQLQLCTDVIIAGTNAKFRLPQVSLGVMPAFGGAPRLAQWVGRGKAAEIALSGRYVEAEEAERIGLVASVHEPSEVLGKAIELGALMAENSPLSIALTKESLVGALESGTLSSVSEADNYRFMALSQSAWAVEHHAGWRDRKRGAAASAAVSDHA